MQAVVPHHLSIAHPVRWLPLYHQLELSLQLVRQDDWPDLQFDQPEQWPPNVVRFRPRRERDP